MRRTARALSLATATGAALVALAPAVFAGTVPDDGASWGAASHAPCPEPGEHGWEPDAPEPGGPEAAVPKSTALDGPGAESDAGLDPEDPEDPEGPEGLEGLEAGIPAPEEPEDAEELKGLEDAEDPEESDPDEPGAVGPKAPKPEPTAY